MVERKLDDVCSLVELMGVICGDLKESQSRVLELRRTRRGDVIHDQNLLTSIRQNSADLSSAAIAGRIWVDGLIATLNEKDALSPLVTRAVGPEGGGTLAAHTETVIGAESTPLGTAAGAARTPFSGEMELGRTEPGRKDLGFYQNVTSFVVEDNTRAHEETAPEESLLADAPRPAPPVRPVARRLRGNVKVDANKALQDCAFLDVDSLGHSSADVGAQNPAGLFAFGLGCPASNAPPPAEVAVQKAAVLPKRRVSISAKFQQTMNQMTQDLRELEG
ncbi:hypothetical protein GNI_076390 [Gregarina niphandrodes]|uniref:Uncharacterized protein n=1 Tax=Gregarina niphandrodes TaxID=110365 RepID=A0A023B6U0_GRENI|nr:hypothetical protein GNI_076390 [Gregarina niphandrodes]EZG66758.1 hypothetical protein GNI_076390 [Gregarina niphandrodes]|eukprot:XP_011130501.1 hypothetical protein GNI_076390 [Gregarina niphandrodes]